MRAGQAEMLDGGKRLLRQQAAVGIFQASACSHYDKWPLLPWYLLIISCTIHNVLILYTAELGRWKQNILCRYPILDSLPMESSKTIYILLWYRIKYKKTYFCSVQFPFSNPLNLYWWVRLWRRMKTNVVL